MDFSAIDWQRPWLSHVCELGRQLAESSDWKAAANILASERGLTNTAGLPIVFVPQEALPKSIGYEAHISETGQVPTRDNLHDFFNALIWLHFPKIKRVLNQLQAEALHRQPDSGLRGRQRDAATLFDENAALFISRAPSLTELLRQRQWHSLLLSSASSFRDDCKVILFGHALIEKLVNPYKSITAHVWCLPSQHGIMNDHESALLATDEAVAVSIASGFASSDFCHLPVLGIPGWWTGQDEAFYADATVFRPFAPGTAEQDNKKTRQAAGEEN